MKHRNLSPELDKLFYKYRGAKTNGESWELERAIIAQVQRESQPSEEPCSLGFNNCPHNKECAEATEVAAIKDLSAPKGAKPIIKNGFNTSDQLQSPVPTEGYEQ